MGDTIYSTDATTPTTPPARTDWGAILAAAIAALALVALAWLEKIAWDKISFAESTLQRAHSTALNSGVKFQESMATLTLELLLFQVSGAEENRSPFQDHARQLSSQITHAKTNAQTPAEAALLTKLDQALQSFLAAAENFVPQRAVRRDTVSNLSNALEREAHPFNSTVTELISLQNQARQRFATESTAAFAAARQALQASILALVAMLASFALLLHRTFFLPLKSRLDAAAAANLRHQKLASLGVLATGVAHEIRNPLTAIKLRLFCLKKAIGPALSENDDFQTIRSEIDRLERLTKSFLEFARPAEPQTARINSSELLQSVQRLLAPELEPRKININVDAAELLEFSGDRQQLQQVLINLAQNARDSMPSGGTITLRAHSGVAMLPAGRAPAVLLDVTDTGPGIAPEVQERLFDPFFSTREGGTGLGLAIASRIVEQHGGLIQFSTRAGQGSTFTIVLPKEKPNAAIENSPHRG